ncbi:MAG: hypothetical protein ACLPN1_09620 [Dissulfurispiraceae bacterium]
METMVMDTCSLLHVLDSQQPELCPYHDAVSNICNASLSSITVDMDRNSGYCSTDNYDNCALFLAKTLRKK